MSLDLTPLFRSPWPLIGVVHLPALPGSPESKLTMSELRSVALADTEALAKGGCDGIIVENFGDHPFFPSDVEPITVASMTLLTADIAELSARLRPERPPAIGVNVLRNDAIAALSIAEATGVSFIRVNVHVGAMVTDQGIIQGQAHQTLRLRRRLGSRVAVLADVLVKHAHPLGPAALEAVAKDTFLRGSASALILSGEGTGEPTDLERVRRVRTALPQAPLLVGSGLTLETFADSFRVLDGAIVGTALKEGGAVDRPVSLERVKAFVRARDLAMIGG